MSAVFNAYKFSKRLQEKGMDQKTAETFTEALDAALFETVATREQLENVRLELSGKLDALDQRLSGVDQRLNGRIDALSTRFDALTAQFKGLRTYILAVGGLIFAPVLAIAIKVFTL